MRTVSKSHALEEQAVAWVAAEASRLRKDQPMGRLLIMARGAYVNYVGTSSHQHPDAEGLVELVHVVVTSA